MLIWLVITPNVALVNVVFGLPNSTVLVALNDSARKVRDLLVLISCHVEASAVCRGGADVTVTLR
jgi:hypothetical protein